MLPIGRIAVIGRKRIVDTVKDAIGSVNYTHDIEFVFCNAMIDEDMRVMKNCIRDVDVVLAGGYHGNRLKQLFPNKPVVTITPSAFDIFVAIHQAKKIEQENVHVVSFHELPSIRIIEDIVGTKVLCHRFESSGDIMRILERVADRGQKSVIGGSLVYEQAPRYGLLPFFYYSRESIEGALRTAVNVILTQTDQKNNRARLSAVLDLVDCALLVVGSLGMVEFANTPATRLFEKPKEMIVGTRFARLLPEPLLNGVRGDSELVTVNSQKVLCEVIAVGDERIFILRDASTIEKTSREARRQLTPKRMSAKYTFSDIVGRGLANVVRLATQYAELSDAPVLITGPSGCGKEMFAAAIHNGSTRRGEQFVAVNCAALPESLLESELFGYEEGAFTGAKKKGKIGLVALAHKGTLFLDEIGELSPSIQSKLLRVIQEKEFIPIGGEAVIPVDIRIIAATNKDLAKEVDRGAFRADLYYRISALVLNIPPLKDRRGDIPLLIDHLLVGYQSTVTEAIKAAIMKLFRYHCWPGNVRELENILERVKIFMRSNLDLESCDADLTDLVTRIETFLMTACYGLPSMSHAGREGSDRMGKGEAIRYALAITGGNKSKAAEVLGISRTTLWRAAKREQGLFQKAPELDKRIDAGETR